MQGEAVLFSGQYKIKQISFSVKKLPRSNLTINNNTLKTKCCSKNVGIVVYLPRTVSTDLPIASINII